MPSKIGSDRLTRHLEPRIRTESASVYRDRALRGNAAPRVDEPTSDSFVRVVRQRCRMERQHCGLEQTIDGSLPREASLQECVKNSVDHSDRKVRVVIRLAPSTHYTVVGMGLKHETILSGSDDRRVPDLRDQAGNPRQNGPADRRQALAPNLLLDQRATAASSLILIGRLSRP
jgi:hypothetical protein